MEARVVETRLQAGNSLVSFQWVGLESEQTERLETFVFDAVLDELKQ